MKRLSWDRAKTPSVSDMAFGTIEYREGYEAFMMGMPDHYNPYQRGPRRQNWYVGWHDARTAKRFAEVFRRWESTKS